MTEFKVGDRVVARETSESNGIKAGEEYIVTRAKPSLAYPGRQLLTLDNGGPESYSSRFYRVEPEPKFKKGDCVRIIAEVYGTNRAGDFLYFGAPGVGYVDTTSDEVAVEKIEPPVVTFEPGQTVRNKASGRLYSIGSDGYYSHQRAEYFKPGPGDAGFTSFLYELVELR